MGLNWNSLRVPEYPWPQKIFLFIQCLTCYTILNTMDPMEPHSNGLNPIEPKNVCVCAINHQELQLWIKKLHFCWKFLTKINSVFLKIFYWDSYRNKFWFQIWPWRKYFFDIIKKLYCGCTLKLQLWLFIFKVRLFLYFSVAEIYHFSENFFDVASLTTLMAYLKVSLFMYVLLFSCSC